MAWSTCRHCREPITGEGVRYAVRHHMHFACYLDSGKTIAKLTDWQVGQFPFRLIRERGLEAEVQARMQGIMASSDYE